LVPEGATHTIPKVCFWIYLQISAELFHPTGEMVRTNHERINTEGDRENSEMTVSIEKSFF